MFSINTIFIALIASCLISSCSNPAQIKKVSLSKKKNQSLKMVVQKGHSGAITSIAFSPDGKFFVSGSNDFNLVLWELSTGREIKTFRGHEDAVTSVAFSPDGRYIVSGSRDKTVRIWDIFEDHMHVNHGQSETDVTAVIISPSGSDMVTGHRSGSLKRWRIPDGKLLDDRRAHSQSDVTSYKINKWNRRAPAEIRDKYALVASQILHNRSKYGKYGKDDPTGHLSSVVGISYPTNNRYVSVGKDGIIANSSRFFGISTKRMKGSHGIIKCVDFSPDSKSFATVDDNNDIILWHASSGEKIRKLVKFQHVVTSIAFSHDGHLLLVGEKNGNVSLYKVLNGEKLREFKSNRKRLVIVEMSPDGLNATAGYADGIVQMWDISSGRLIRQFTGRSAAANDIAIFSTGRNIVSAHSDGTLKLWDVLTGEQRLVYRGHTDSATSVSLSPDRRTIASGSDDGNIILWDIATGKKNKIINAHDPGVVCVKYSPNGNYIFSAGKDNTIIMWDIRTGHKKKNLVRLDFEVTCIAVSNNGRYLAFGSKGKTFKVFDLSNEMNETKINGHFRGVFALAFSSDDRYIISGGGDNAIRLWDVKTGRQIKVYQDHNATVTSVLFSNDDRYILSGSNDGIIQLQDINTGSVLKRIKGTVGQINSLAFSRKGNFFVSAGADAIIRKWTADLENEVIRMHGSRDGEWATTTADGYYKTSPEGKNLVHWATFDNIETFSFEQFETFTNKPTIIARRISGDFAAGKPFPRLSRPANLELQNHMGLVFTSQQSYVVQLKIKGEAIVKTVRLFTNGRPTVERILNKSEAIIQIDIPLVVGVNRISAIAYDENGLSSNLKWIDVVSTATGSSKPSLHVLGIGISQYPNLSGQWQLDFAHTDAQSFIKAFQNQRGKLFDKVNSNYLANQEASVGNITSALKTLSAIDTNDVAVIFMAGHGIRDLDGTYYFLTSDGTLDNPNAGGISWNLISGYLNRIKGRVILFLDTCHSGSIVNETVVPNDELSQEFFSGKRGGTMVFSASKGRQYSMESPDFGGGFGIFTYALTQGLVEMAEEVDISGNGFVEFMELVEYVSRYVDNTTNGEQTPWLSRKELFGDLPLAVVE